MNHLTSDDIAQFDEEGYLVFEGLFDHDLNERIKADVDQLMIDRENGQTPHAHGVSRTRPAHI